MSANGGYIALACRGHALAGAYRQTGEVMKKLRMLAALAVAIALAGAPMTLLARGHSGGSSHTRSSGSHHYGNQGGHYPGGHGSSHKGGHYVNPRTGNHYTHHSH